MALLFYFDIKTFFGILENNLAARKLRGPVEPVTADHQRKLNHFVSGKKKAVRQQSDGFFIGIKFCAKFRHLRFRRY